ncbi:hypothetical protein SVIOM342S_05364 [Streptomyces violaceorubidus]
MAGTAGTPGTPRVLRAMNDRAALDLLLEHGPLSRTRIGKLTGLSKPTASQLLARLEAAGPWRAVRPSGARGPAPSSTRSTRPPRTPPGSTSPRAASWPRSPTSPGARSAGRAAHPRPRQPAAPVVQQLADALDGAVKAPSTGAVDQAPPKTWSQFAQVAKKLTKPKGDGYEQLGFMPNYHGYETVVDHYMSQWDHAYFDEDGKSSVAEDPAFAEMFTYQKKLVDDLGGFGKLERYRNTFGDEWGAKHPFQTGQVAMQLDGEWRLGMAKDAGVGFEIGTAPMPVADDEVAEYGKGFLSGTVMGIAPQSRKQNAAWELVKYMTTDTEAVVAFANAIRNVPSTFPALKSPGLKTDPAFKTFLDIAQHPESNSPPASVNGATYQLTLQDFGYQYESGKVKDLKAGLEKTAAQIDRDIAQAK